MSRTPLLALALVASAFVIAPSAWAKKTVVNYDDFNKPGYNSADYAAKWTNSFGPGELAAGGTQSFAGGREEVDATPFQTAADFSVFDHVKYIAASTQT